MMIRKFLEKLKGWFRIPLGNSEIKIEQIPRRWTHDEVKTLKLLRLKGWSVYNIGLTLDRSVSSVSGKINRVHRARKKRYERPDKA